MMKKIGILFVLIALFGSGLIAQQTRVLTLEDALELAKEQSQAAIRAKHTFRNSYWQHRTYKAEYLPNLVFSGTTPNFSRAMSPVQQNDGTYRYHQDYSNRITGSLSLEQNVPFTGGTLSMGSNLSRTDVLGDNGFIQYMSSPVTLRYSQNLFGVNPFKWNKKIEPLRYEEAKRTYLYAMENVSLTAINYFFALAEAQQRVATAEFNKANTDTLSKIANGRYQRGTIGEDEKLQSELNYMNAIRTYNDAVLTLQNSKNRMRSFLGFNELVDISIDIPNEFPRMVLDTEKIMDLAKANSPDMLAYERQLIEAERGVAQARANRGFNATANLEFGLDQRANNLADVYKNPGDMERVSIGLRVPLLDWGRGKGYVKMAQSSQELVKMQVEQAISDFEQNVITQVDQYNKQYDQFEITSKSDSIARNRYNVAMQRYRIDKITITEMNQAQTDRDNARQSYVAAIRNFWQYYYTIRQLTLYDLTENKPLAADYDQLVE